MKTINKYFLILILSLGSIGNSFAQDCISHTDFTGTVDDYNNDVIYPMGATLTSEGDLSIIKTLASAPGPGYFQQTSFLEISPTEVAFHGYLTFDVSAATNPCRELTINAFAERIIVDGDTTNYIGTTFPHIGSGYILDTISANVFIITGEFDQTDIWIPTGFFYEACLEGCPTPPSSGCLDATSFTDDLADYNNDVIYPMGSTLATTGDLSIIKTLESAPGPGYFQQTSFLSIDPTEVLFHGYLTFDVSAASFPCRELTINAFAERIIVDGDTINYIGTTFPHIGSGFTLDTIAAGIFIVIGEFDQTDIWIPTGIFYEACIDTCATPPSSGCLDATSFTDDLADYNNDVTYPMGASLATTGDLTIIKTLASAPGPGYFQQTSFLSIDPTEVLFHGYLTFDVSAASYPCRELTINATAERIMVNGDTINLIGATLPYVGTEFTLDTLMDGILLISGEFDQVDIWIPTGIFYVACLDSCADCHAGFTYEINQSNVTFTNTSSISANDADAFMWDFGDGSTSANNNPTHAYSAPGIYTVCLTIVDEDCINSTMEHCKTITISGCPTGHFTITPNNDGDADNIFIPSGSIIYNRNGIIVKTIIEDLDWYGVDDKNQLLPMGYYVVKCGEFGVFNITIVR
ncbi:MAG: hypothetical protein ACI8ZM_004801 [Crocinitomix sp.]|jgi:hypothetical protein